MAKAKSKFVMVWLRSVVTGNKALAIRPRNNEKVEVLRWDPVIQQISVYKEEKKHRSARR